MFGWDLRQVARRSLVGGILLLFVAIFAVRSGVWQQFSEATGIGNPNANVATPSVREPTQSSTSSSSGSSASPSTSSSGSRWSWNSKSDDSSSATTSDATKAATEALATLGTLTVNSESAPAYNRTEDFGPAWKDVDNNGCDTRNDILARDLTNTKYQSGSSCVVVSGTLNDPYTGKTIDFTRGKSTSSAVQIDHVVALKNAWVTGAKNWDDAKRLQLANDPINLLAVDGPSNTQKSDSDASKWLPSNKDYRCTYVEKQITVKAKYGLWVTPDEKKAMTSVLQECD